MQYQKTEILSGLIGELSKSVMCGICLDDLNDPSALSCSHVFCNTCLSSILRNEKKCPLCAANIKTKSAPQKLHDISPVIGLIRQLIDCYNSNDTALSKQVLRERRHVYTAGDIVEVAPRTWPGINRPGGTAWVTNVHTNSDGTEEKYDVRYVLGGLTDSAVPGRYIRPADGMERQTGRRTRNAAQVQADGRHTSASFKRPKRRSVTPDVDAPEMTQSAHVTDSRNSERSRSIERKPTAAEDIVLIASALDESQQKVLSSFRDIFPSSRMVDSYSTEVTHVVVAAVRSNQGKKRSRKVIELKQRTMKYLMGVLEGKWIVCLNWLQECIDAKRIVPEDPYEVERDYKAAPGVKGTPKLSREITQRGDDKLFSRRRFLLHGSYPSPGPTGSLLQTLITLGGGTMMTLDDVINAVNVSLDKGMKVDKSKHIYTYDIVIAIVSSEEFATNLCTEVYKAISKLRLERTYDIDDFVDHLSGMIFVAKSEWVFDCISNYCAEDPRKSPRSINMHIEVESDVVL